MAYRNPYRPSASLIHELRMIVQTFIRHRTSRSLFAPEVKSAGSSLQCVPCIRTGERKIGRAIAISDGASVCEKHLG